VDKKIGIVISVLLLIAGWWFFHEDPEADVREAHAELARLLSKAESDPDRSMLVDARRMQNLFAETCDVTGDAEMFVGSYTREDMVSTIVQVQAMFTNVELTFHELEVEFPAEDDARVNYTAVLVSRSTMTDGEAVAETRDVVSRLRKIEGEWLFSEFRLAKLIQNSEK